MTDHKITLSLGAMRKPFVFVDFAMAMGARGGSRLKSMKKEPHPTIHFLKKVKGRVGFVGRMKIAGSWRKIAGCGSKTAGNCRKLPGKLPENCRV